MVFCKLTERWDDKVAGILKKTQAQSTPDRCGGELAFIEHDHTQCILQVLAQAEEAAFQKNQRLTPVRRRVLEILLEEHKALGAYAILDRLSHEGMGSYPPIVYRALDFLVALGFVHKVHQLNAFTACTNPKNFHRPSFLICSSCDVVAEMHSIVAHDPKGVMQSMGFEIEHSNIEAIGLCSSCLAKDKRTLSPQK